MPKYLGVKDPDFCNLLSNNSVKLHGVKPMWG